MAGMIGETPHCLRGGEEGGRSFSFFTSVSCFFTGMVGRLSFHAAVALFEGIKFLIYGGIGSALERGVKGRGGWR